MPRWGLGCQGPRRWASEGLPTAAQSEAAWQPGLLLCHAQLSPRSEGLESAALTCQLPLEGVCGPPVSSLNSSQCQATGQQGPN